MSRKKLLSIAISLILVLSAVLTGCGDSGAVSGNGTQASATSATDVTKGQTPTKIVGEKTTQAEESTTGTQAESTSGTASSEESNAESGQDIGEESNQETGEQPPLVVDNHPVGSDTQPAVQPEEEPAAWPSEQPAAQPEEEPVAWPSEQPAAQPEEEPQQTIAGTTLHMFTPATDSEKSTAQSIVSSITNDSMSEYGKVKAIHDYLVNHVSYDLSFSSDSIYRAQGAFDGWAVCQGYTDAFSLLCSYAGIQAEIVSGTADNGQVTMGHAWNLVRVDGVWYAVDVTWDDPVGMGDFLRYDYFLVPESVISQDHVAESYSNYYACTDSRYLSSNAKESVMVTVQRDYAGVPAYYVTNKAEVNNAVQSAKAAGNTEFVIAFHTANISEDITMEDISDAAFNASYGGISMRCYSDSIYMYHVN